MTTNNSGIIPVGVSVLVYPREVKVESESGLITMSESMKEKEQLGETIAKVIEISPMAYYDESKRRCNVGDTVVIAKYAGFILKGKDGKVYRLIKDNDVVAKMEE
jgi:co-chaperonin GroES (HSP10)